MNTLDVTGGCGCKLPQPELERLLSHLDDSDLEQSAAILDYRDRADVGAVPIDDEYALISTVDFGSPVSREPFTWGRIAAENALSDLYAAGATPWFGMNILAWPAGEESGSAAAVLRGGRQTLELAGALLLGGHSLSRSDTLYGLSVSGRVRRRSLMRLDAANVGDVLVLSKPLGSGIYLAAQMVGEATSRQVDVVEASMMASNRAVSQLALEFDVRCATDVSGFGLVGHLEAVLRKSGVSATVDAESVPLLDSTLDLLNLGIVPTRAEQIMMSASGVDWTQTGFDRRLALCDPQTSGGLLMAVGSERADGFLATASSRQIELSVIGEIDEHGPRGRIKVV